MRAAAHDDDDEGNPRSNPSYVSHGTRLKRLKLRMPISHAAAHDDDLMDEVEGDPENPTIHRIRKKEKDEPGRLV